MQPSANQTTQSYYDYNDTSQQVSNKSAILQTNLQQPHDSRPNTSTPTHQGHMDTYLDNIPAITTTEHTQLTDYQSHQHYTDQHTSPSNIQHQHSPMCPPQQSPQVLIPNSPHVAPQSPQVPQKSPLMHPNSPHIPPQSPHFTHTGPMLSPGPQQTSYNPRCRASSISKVTPADLTPPPGTPSPSKHSPDRYQQYLQQNRLPQKSPNVTVNREMQYNAAVVPPLVSQNMQNLNGPTTYPQSHQQPMINGGQHFFPTNQYLDTGYFNSYQMQIAQAAAPTGVYNAQVPTGNPAAATTGMYGYR